jgi:hypothetical protein
MIRGKAIITHTVTRASHRKNTRGFTSIAKASDEAPPILLGLDNSRIDKSPSLII